MNNEQNTAEDRGMRYDQVTNEIWVRLDIYEKVCRERDQYKLAAEMNKQTIEQMSRGEYICIKCGIRKDGEHSHAEF